MRLACYNLQNLFDRPRVLNRDLWVTEGDGGSLDDRFEGAAQLLELYAKVNRLIAKPVYDAADRAAIRDALIILGLERSDDTKYILLRQNKGRLVRRPRAGGLEIVATGRRDWVGWVELKREAVSETATENTARVLKEVDADIVATIEIEDRIPLLRFNEQILPLVSCPQYDHVMAINGNDDRGIDVGIMSRGYPLKAICSHVDDRDAAGARIFSRDCARFLVETPSGQLWLLINHLKSKGYGDFQESQRRRRAQAQRVREIYNDLRNEGAQYVAVLGDFNDTIGSQPLAPLFDAGLRDVSHHPNYVESDGRRGTFGNCANGDQIDLILLSPELFERVTRSGVERRGIWGGVNGTLFPHFPTITRAEEAASDHAAVWVDLEL